MGEDDLTRRQVLAILGGTAAGGAVALDRMARTDDCAAYGDESVYERPSYSVTVADHADEFCPAELDIPANETGNTSYNESYNVSVEDAEDT